jgi:hypothetical protein
MAGQAVTLGRQVAAWQLSHMDNFDYTHGHPKTPDPRGWVQGALFVGLGPSPSAAAIRPWSRRFATMGSGRAGTWAAVRCTPTTT